MNVLPPRPLKLRASFVAWYGVGGALLGILGVAIFVGGLWGAATLELMGAVVALMGPVLVWFSWLALREVLLARLCARESSEIELHLADEERHGFKHAPHSRNLETRIYFFRAGDRTIRHGAGKATERPLFLDEAHTRALGLKSARGILIVRTDLGPFAFAPSEERAIRERLEKLRDAA